MTESGAGGDMDGVNGARDIDYLLSLEMEETEVPNVFHLSVAVENCLKYLREGFILKQDQKYLSI